MELFMSWEIVQGDCLEVMKSYPDNHFSCVVTDPPYGISFMGKGWDYCVPGVEYWKECLRVVKPGGYILAMGGTRTVHRLTCAIEDSGFQIRDCLMWIYGSGFPKSHNHFGLEGYGTAIKPAYEPIIMAMKPCDGTFKQNIQKWGQAGINIDECRIEGKWERSTTHRDDIRGGSFIKDSYKTIACAPQKSNEKGRWPANVLFDEEAATILDEQSGIGKSGSSVSGTVSSGASRFFYCAKAGASERGDSNNHPTVKPLKLMEYLIKLVMPPKDGILLDPFSGSGTTILAAKRMGHRAVGLEKSLEYCEIAKSRVA